MEEIRISIVWEDGKELGQYLKVIEALLRNRIFCPRCGKPMVVRRRTECDKIYYYCSRLIHASTIEYCTYHRYVPGIWDTVVWDCIYAILKDDVWVQEQLSTVEKQNHDIEKLVKLEQHKIFQSQTKIAKIREGFEGGLYNLNEARNKVNGYQDTINKAEQEMKRLMGAMEEKNPTVKVEELKKELERLAQENLDEATFTEKRDIINKLGIRVYPSEDLKTMKIRCSLNFGNDANSQSNGGCAIIQIASLRSQRPNSDCP